jgi:hypothetical protein
MVRIKNGQEQTFQVISFLIVQIATDLSFVHMRPSVLYTFIVPRPYWFETRYFLAGKPHT